MPLKLVHIPLLLLLGAILYYSFRLIRHFRHALSSHIPRVEVVAGFVEEPQEHLRLLSEWTASRLGDLGFALHSKLSLVTGEGKPGAWQVVYENKGQCVYAVLRLSPGRDLTRASQVLFRSYMAGGETHTTYCCVPWQDELKVPHHRAYRCLAPTLEKHLKTHKRNTDGADREVLVSSEQLVKSEREKNAVELGALTAQGFRQPEGHSAFRLTPRYAAWTALRAVFPTIVDGETENLRRRLASAAPVEVWVSHFHWLRAIDRLTWTPSPVRARDLHIFGLSLAVFAWSLGFLSPLPLISILAALLIHEAGHLLAMRALGYQNTRIFFLPFTGAVATGIRGRPVSAAQLAFMYLMGPSPGLCIAGLLWAAGQWLGEARLLSVSIFFLAINAFNLLPIVPLDGGRLALLIVPNRLAWPRVSLLIASIVFSVGLAWLLRTPALTLIAIPAILMLRREIPLAAAMAASAGGEPTLDRCFGVLNGARFSLLPLAAKLYVAREYEKLMSQTGGGRAFRMLLLIWVVAVFGSGWAIYTLVQLSR